METKTKKSVFYFSIFLVVLFGIISFFNNALAIGLFFLLFLTAATFFVIFKSGIKDKKIYIVFLVGLLVHLGAVLFIYYGHFRPFGGGADFEEYNKTGIEIANRFSQGNFSLQGLYTEHFFPVLIGILYMFTFPSMIVGQLFTVWLAAVSILLAYLIVLQIGGTKKIAFLVSLIVSLYPSYLYFGSLLLKDTLVTPFVLAGILLILRMVNPVRSQSSKAVAGLSANQTSNGVENFSWSKFLLFFIILTCLINLRFYIGYALMFTCIISWPLLSSFNFKKKMIYWPAIIFLLGFSSQIVGNGYYGLNSFKKLLNPEKITYYREVLYNNPSLNSQPSVSQPSIPQPSVSQPTVPPLSTTQTTIIQPSTFQQSPPPASQKQEVIENNSTFSVKTGFEQGHSKFLKNSFESFMYSLLGPFPWQFRAQRQALALAETIPWYLLIIISFYGCIRFIIKNSVVEFLKFHKFTLPLLLFSILALGALSLYINNYGIIARIRIPVFICLISAISINFSNRSNNNYEKISYYWGRWVHRLPFIRSPFTPGQ